MKYVGGILQVLTETAFMLIFAVILIGAYILQMQGRILTHLLFGFSVIFFYHVFQSFKFRVAIALNSSLAVIIIFVLSAHPAKIAILRNFLWFLLIGAYTYYLPILENKPLFRSSFIWDLFFWVFGFIGIYLCIALINLYVFRIYHAENANAAFMYFKYFFKVSGVLGFGAGTGRIVNNLLNRYIWTGEQTFNNGFQGSKNKQRG
jgi:hypothetical protein